jgi:predicted KAP-like P-loop ATPase
MKKIGIIDQPHKDISNDLLNIFPHAESLSIFIKECDTPITIGIQGEWGSGKTSLMHLTIFIKIMMIPFMIFQLIKK